MTSIQSIEASQPRQQFSSRLVLDVLPVAAVVFVGTLTIAFWTGGGQRGSHVYWLSAVLAENAFALLMRRRHPATALAGVVVAYVVTDALPVVLLPLFVALSTVVVMRSRRVAAAAGVVTALAVVAVPILHRDDIDLFHVVVPLAVIALALVISFVGRSVSSAVRPIQRHNPAASFET